jgi:hypothetical protein
MSVTCERSTPSNTFCRSKSLYMMIDTAGYVETADGGEKNVIYLSRDLSLLHTFNRSIVVGPSKNT